jgi:DNA polymerase III delta prime subunit
MAFEMPKDEYIPMTEGLPKEISIILVGPPKVGKTTTAVSFPKSLLLECDPDGGKYIKCRKSRITGLEDLREAWKALKDDTVYETIVVDTLDQVSAWHVERVCKDFNIPSIMESPGKERHGAQWDAYAEGMLGFVQAWLALKKRIVFVAHSKKLEVGPNGVIVAPKTINLYGRAASAVLSLVENIGWIYAEETPEGIIRKLDFRPSTTTEAGTRHPALRDKVVTLPINNPFSVIGALFYGPAWPQSDESKTEAKKKETKRAAPVAAGVK